MKGAQKRLREIATFIEKNNHLRNDVARVVAAHCRHFVDTTRIGPAFPNRKAADTFSKSLSQKNNPNAGEKTQRDYRRALRLMNQSLDRMQEGAGIDAMASANLVPAFKALAEEIFLFADKTGAACRAELNEFTTQPKSWLEQNEIFIRGHKEGDNGPVRGSAWFRMFYEPGRRRFVFEPLADKDANPDQPGHRFEAIHVPAVAYDHSEHRDFQDLKATELTGAKVMLTTQFSGCSFCFVQDRGKTYAAHIAPDERRTGQDPIVLAKQLSGTSGGQAATFDGLGSAGPVTVYGRGAEGTSGDTGYVKQLKAMMVIGADVGGRWKLFSQHVSLGQDSKPKVYELL